MRARSGSTPDACARRSRLRRRSFAACTKRRCSAPCALLCSKIFISLLAGCFAGITGITGYKGFLVYLVAHVLMAGLLMLKAGFQAERFFPAS